MKLFEDFLTNRYLTLERNIKSRSNSFYDSYLDLLEATIKYFLTQNNIEFDGSKTCGFLVREPEIKDFLKKKLKIDDFTFSKIPDYIKKCNDHKHKKEKWLEEQTVISYLKVYFDLVNYYIDYIKGIPVEFDAEYYHKIFGETERINQELKVELADLQEKYKNTIDESQLSKQDLEKYKEICSLKSLELMNLEEQNKVLKEKIEQLNNFEVVNARLTKIEENQKKQYEQTEQLLNEFRKIQNQPKETPTQHATPTQYDEKAAIKKFLKSSKKEYFWFGSKKEFARTRRILQVVGISLLIFGALATILTSIACRLYTTFTLLENIWFGISILILLNSIKLKKRMTDTELMASMNYKFIRDADGTWRVTNKEKSIYKWARRVSYIAVLANIITIWCFTRSSIAGWATFFELAVLGLSIGLFFANVNLTCMYSSFILYTGKNLTTGQDVTLILDVHQNKLAPYEEYKKLFERRDVL